jgi:diadenosine tetraphosphate (Ap4A) HIT family hydrolase
MNATMEKFGYPGSLVTELRHWAVLLRPAQATLGALVLAAKSDVTQFSDLRDEAFAELAAATRAVERGLSRFRPYSKINYLMLMMVDPHVHFHVLPRYAGAEDFAGRSFVDPGWPGIPDLKHQTELGETERGLLLDAMRQAFSAG